MLMDLRIKDVDSKLEYKIRGLSNQTSKELFLMIQKGEETSEPLEAEISVYDYFFQHRKIQLWYSGDLPCIIVGKPEHPTYLPMELFSLLSLQCYTNALSSSQQASLVKRSRQNPQERMNAITHALTSSSYADDPLLRSLGISITSNFIQIQGRVLEPPKLRFGNGVDFIPQKGRWNFNNKTFVKPIKLVRWAVVNFSTPCDMKKLCEELIRCGQDKGMSISQPFSMFEENSQLRDKSAPKRVDEMFKMLGSVLPRIPQFLLCILPEKNSNIYGPWKRKNLCEQGITTQCIVPEHLNDQYLTNVVLKINAKLGGINSLLASEQPPSIPVVSKVPTLIVGMDIVSHSSPRHSNIPSIAVVVSSRQWPLISRYQAAVRAQPPKLEMINSLFQKVSDTKDEGVFRELLVDFSESSGRMKPEQIIIFRNVVSEVQFNQVLNVEFEQIREACKFLDKRWSPKFTVVAAEKNHHTKLFLTNSPDNVPPGTVVDKGICHPRWNDFYICAHAEGAQGTTEPAHYQVLYDELEFSPDDLQELVHSLSYVYQRSTAATSVVAPLCYARLAAAQMSQIMNLDDVSDQSSSHTGAASLSLPRLHENVSNSMFFC